MNGRETVEIYEADLDHLEDTQDLLVCLYAHGVDNWEGWDDSVDCYNDGQEDV